MENRYTLKQTLMGISDMTLGFIILVLYSHCNPSRSNYPIEQGEKPAWWPEEEPYTMPNNLKKKAKVNLLVAIIEHMTPNFSKMEKVVRKSKTLDKTMSSLEAHIWSSLMSKLRNGGYNKPQLALTHPGPSNVTNEERTSDKGKGLLQEHNQELSIVDYQSGPQETSHNPNFTQQQTFLTGNEPSVDLVQSEGLIYPNEAANINPNQEEGGFIDSTLLNVDQPQIPSSPNDQTDIYNDRSLVYDQEFWRFMNNKA